MEQNGQKGRVEKVLIVGSGAAGLTAAIYAARANLEPLVLEGMQPGGQLTITSDVENYPGFPEGIQGPDLMDAMKKQAERFGARCLSEDVAEVSLEARPFTVRTDRGEYASKSLIIATGASAIGEPGRVRAGMPSTSGPLRGEPS